MKKNILLIIACFLISPAINSALALDEGGCLTCHQYPGLVRLAKKNGLKALHIDEDKYFSSPHGKIRCVKCHITVEKVPHAGETEVDCTTECHQGGKEKKLPADYQSTLKDFHKQEQSYISSLQDESSCRVCHPLYPHSENKLVRGFLNLHAGFMFCEVCHINRDKFNNLSYEWESSESAEFQGTPFGTHYNPQTKKAVKHSLHFISRIAAFKNETGRRHALMNTRDTARAQAFVLKEKNLAPDDKKQELTYFHRDIEKKEISVACDECHSANSILDFNKLGFDQKKTKDLIYLNIKGLVTKYKTFYFPKLF